jgi:two-component system NtrC family sensor kinase
MAVNESYFDDLTRQIPSIEVDATGVIIAVGPAAASFCHTDAERLLGQRFDELFPLDSASRQELRIVAPELSGEPAPIHFRLVTLSGAAGGRLHLLIDAADLHRARRECVNLTRLASAGRLISSIVHEINNPLSGIIGYSQLLLMRELDPDVRNSLEKVYGEALRTSRIIRNLLDFSRRRAPARGGVKLGRILRKALELKSHDLRVRNVSVHLDVPDSLPPIYGDQHQLLQVFVNLISNSEQAMYGSDRGGRITFHGTGTAHEVTLLMQDTGPGIPEPLRTRVFEPFFTTKEEGQGTGLGLSLCREILERQQASIRLLDSSESGAAFQLAFRIFRADDPSFPPIRKVRAAVRVQGKRIVVVEDDPVCRSMIAEAFERSQNTVHAFDRSESALRFLRAHQADVVVSDLHRPGLNGLEFHKRVALFDPGLAARILYLTGDALNPDLVVFLRKTGNVHLSKPVLLNDLFAAVQKILARPGARQKTLFGGDEATGSPANGRTKA